MSITPRSHKSRYYIQLLLEQTSVVNTRVSPCSVLHISCAISSFFVIFLASALGLATTPKIFTNGLTRLLCLLTNNNADYFMGDIQIM